MGYVASNAHVQGSKYADVTFAQAKGIAASLVALELFDLTLRVGPHITHDCKTRPLLFRDPYCSDPYCSVFR
jgi:hypothetical protein